MWIWTMMSNIERVFTFSHSTKPNLRRSGWWFQSSITSLIEYSKNVVSCRWCSEALVTTGGVGWEFCWVVSMMCKNNNPITARVGLKGNTQLQLCVHSRIRNFLKCAIYTNNIVICTKEIAITRQCTLHTGGGSYFTCFHIHPWRSTHCGLHSSIID